MQRFLNRLQDWWNAPFNLEQANKHITQLYEAFEEIGYCWECRKPFAECELRLKLGKGKKSK